MLIYNAYKQSYSGKMQFRRRDTRNIAYMVGKAILKSKTWSEYLLPTTRPVSVPNARTS